MRAIAITLLLLAAPARADDASEAQLQYELGVARYEQARYEEALDHFLASYRLVPAPNVAFNIAATYRLSRRWAEAFNWLETYLTEHPLDDAARQRGTGAQSELLPRVAVVDVRAEPPGALLYVDRIDSGSVGTAPRRVAVEPGDRTLFARLPGHRDAQESVHAERGRIVSVRLSLAAIVGTLSVTTRPEGAEVLVEGREEPLGHTPLETTLPAGTIRLTVRGSGYSEVSRSVTIVDGETASLALTLEPLASTVAVLTVTTEPPGAAVLVDGRRIGSAPLTLDRVEPGTRRLEVRARGTERWSQDVVFEPGGATRVAVTLEDPSAVHFSDLRWIGYGLGGLTLLTGVGLGTAARLERDAFFASENPSRAQFDTIGALNVAADVFMITGVVLAVTTLVLDLAIGPRPRSRARVEVDR